MQYGLDCRLLQALMKWRMERRTALRTLFLVASGAAIIPPSLRGANGASVALNSLNVDADLEALLGEYVEALIPKTDTPGARELNLHLFVLLMVDDCHSRVEQRQFVGGLRQINSLAKNRFGQVFAACTPRQRQLALGDMKNKGKVSGEMFAFNAIAKKRTIQGYLQSEYVMTKLLPHKIVPDLYDGYYPASKLEEA